MEERKEELVFTMVTHHHTKEMILRGVSTTAQLLKVLGFGIRPWFESSLCHFLAHYLISLSFCFLNHKMRAMKHTL